MSDPTPPHGAPTSPVTPITPSIEVQPHTPTDSSPAQSPPLGAAAGGGATRTLASLAQSARRAHVEAMEHERGPSPTPAKRSTDDSEGTATAVGSAPSPVPEEKEGGLRPEMPKLTTTTSTPQSRWQSAVRKTRQVQALTTGKYQWNARPGVNEPGIDAARMDFPQLHRNVLVEVADFDEGHVKHDVMSNRDFIQWLEVGRGRVDERPAWSKVRWINISGISWDVMKSLALAYDLHPLAVEDTIHTGHVTRPKVDYYEHCLFINLQMHSVVHQSEVAASQRASGQRRKPPPPDVEREPGSAVDPEASNEKDPGPWQVPSASKQQLGRSATVAQTTIKKLTSDYKLNIQTTQLNLFLLRDGTFISIFHDGAGGDVAPLFQRLKDANSLLRLTSDPSMLLQSVLDLVVDHGLEICDAFRKELTLLEERVLVKADMKSVRHMFVLSSELLLLKRTLQPLGTVVHALQNHHSHDDVARPAHAGSRRSTSHLHRHDSTIQQHGLQRQDSAMSFGGESDGGMAPKKPFISRQCEVYLADTADHCDTILSSLELFASLGNNLVDFSFNIVSYNMNETMMQMSAVTILFLPLTFLTGYFGMNFAVFDGVVDAGDSVTTFWFIAVPLSIIFSVLFGWSYITRKIGQVRRHFVRWQTTKAVRNNPLLGGNHAKSL